MWDGSAVFCRRTLSVYLCIWSTLLGSAVLFPSDSGHSVNTISAPGQPCLSVSVSARLYHQLVSAESVSGQHASQFLI